MSEFGTKINRVIQRTRDIKSFRMDNSVNMEFKPGQFLHLTIDVEGKKESKYFSISNSPTETGYIEFTKRITSSAYSKALDNIKPGDNVTIKGPMGTFTFEGEYKKIAFLSGGIGITPIRSMCKFVTDKNFNSNIVLLYGNNTEEDIVFRDDFEDMKKHNKNFKVVHTLTSPESGQSGWNGHSGYIDDSMIKKEIPDYNERTFYICGPPRMVETLVNILKDKLAVEKEKIRLENFAGY